MNKINYEKYQSTWAGLKQNETARVSHEECSDTRKRLYFTRKLNAILSFCHNCGLSGVTRNATTHYLPTPPTPINIVNSPIPIPLHCVHDTEPEYPTSLLWNKWVPLTGAVWDPMDECFHIPVGEMYDVNSQTMYTQQGYNTRNINKQPKYLLRVPKTFRGWMLYRGETNPTNTIVLVEDQVSAARLAYINYPAISLFGASHNIEKIHNILQTYKIEDYKFVVWLDNDNKEVIKAAHTITQYITLLGGEVKLWQGTQEPKNCTDEELKRILG